MVKLVNVCDILDNMRIPIKASDRTSGIYPYYGANGIQGYVNDYIFDDELVLLAEDGGNFNSKDKPVAYRVSGKCWVNNHAHVLKPKKGIDTDYLCYALMFCDVSKLINGATRQKLNQSDMLKIEISLYPYKEQLKIANIFNSICNILDLRKKQSSLLNNLIKSRFVEMFGDPATNIDEWPHDILRNHLSVVGGYAFKSSDFSDKGIPVLRIGNINTGKFKKSNIVYWDEDDKLKKYEIYPGDLVISLTGTVGKNDYGNVCIMGNDYSVYYLNQRNAKLDLKDSLNSSYLAEILKFDIIKNKLTGISRGVRQANIANSDILNLRLPIPPIDLQNKFANFVQQVDKSKAVVQKSLDETQLLFDSLMQKYFG